MDNNLLIALINASEKAANIARICRKNEKLLALLVQEKTGTEANSRFEHDFKTLADVLIQETIKHDVSSKFPTLRDIKGEESSNFTNNAGESVSIAVGPKPADTAKRLAAVLHGNPYATELLTAEVHRDVVYTESQLGEIPKLPADLDYSNLGIWIDPIDATAEYISGENMFTDFPGIASSGLDCVTVLIGVYDKSTGEAVAGVVSQPFHHKCGENVYKSHLLWGISLGLLQANNCKSSEAPLPPVRSRSLAICSSSEHADILQSISDLGFELTFSAGAGHKALKVITAEVDLYLLSKGSTFKWDTCAPQAILRSLGGDMYDLKESINQRKAVSVNYLQYLESSGRSGDWKCNKGGLIAIRDLSMLQTLLDKLSE